MEERIVDLLRKSVLCFAVFFSFCLLINPTLNNVSYFGNFIDTIVPYTLAFLGTSLLLLRAAREMTPFDKIVFERYAIRLVAIMMLAVLLTPFMVNRVFLIVHRISDIGLFVCGIVLVARLALRLRNDHILWLLLAAQILCFALLFASTSVALLHLYQLLFELTFGTAFSIGLIRGTRKLLNLAVVCEA
jgi:hypothetical protein